MATDYTGGETNHTAANGYALAAPITITGNGNVSTVGIKWYGTTAGNVRVAIYSPGSGKPANLLAESASVAMQAGAGWQEIPVSYSIDAGPYWVAIQESSARELYYTAAPRSYYAKAYNAFDAVWSAGSTENSIAQPYMSVTYSAGGWTHIAKVHGIAVASIAKVNGVAVASIAKLNGTAV